MFNFLTKKIIFIIITQLFVNSISSQISNTVITQIKLSENITINKINISTQENKQNTSQETKEKKEAVTSNNEYIPNKDISYIHSLVNQERSANGKQPLILDPLLCNFAEIRSSEIYYDFSHYRKDNTQVDKILKDNNYSFCVVGENLGRVFKVETIFDMWIKSSGHHKNMLKDWTRTGIGVKKIGALYYITQIFIK